jgi:hypothetical protein
MKSSSFTLTMLFVIILSSSVSAQTKLSSLNIDDFPTYIVFEMDLDESLGGNLGINIQNSKKSIYRRQLTDLEKKIQDSDASCTPTDLLNEMDAFGYDLHTTFDHDNESLFDRVGYIFKKKSKNDK